LADGKKTQYILEETDREAIYVLHNVNSNCDFDLEKS
jgi:hypothetical protein